MSASQLLFTPASIGPVTLRNRTIRSAAFEGMCENNRPSEMLRAYHRSVAEGGVGMTTLAYASVTRNGLSFDTQMWMRPEIIPALRDITDDIHKAGAKASIQLGHCGNMSHPRTAGQIPISASTGLNIYSPTIVRGMREDEITAMARSFGDAVRLARDAGMDCVEIHAGHGYLISQFLSPYTNRRRDRWGGSLDNRMRFMRLCMEEVMRAAESDMGVVVKTNMRDGFKGGVEIEEGLEIARELQKLGAHALVLSGGFVSKAPMYVMRGAMPIKSMTHYMKLWWLKYGVKMVGRFMIPTIPYKEMYFLDDARLFRRELTMPLIYVGGCSTRESIDTVLGEGFEFVQMGRALLRQPDFVNRMREGELSCGCDHVNYCIARMYSREMACHQNVDDIPACLRREIAKIKERPHGNEACPSISKRAGSPWAVVTGASGGIGLEFCRELGRMGCNLVMVSNCPDDLYRRRAEIVEACGVEAHALDIDLTDDDADGRIMDFLMAHKIVPELLVNNAGIFDFRAVESMSARRIDMYIDLHMRAVTRLTVAIGRLMADNGGGRILNMSSMSCWMPMPGIALYSATKAYIRAFSRAYRVEMLDRGVSVTVACPGGIATDLFGLSGKLQRLGVRLGVLDRPSSFARKALKRTFAGKAQYINGFINRISIVSVASLPECGRKVIKSRLLDRIGGK